MVHFNSHTYFRTLHLFYWSVVVAPPLNMNKWISRECFLVLFTVMRSPVILFGPFRDPNDRFPYPFTCFNREITYTIPWYSFDTRIGHKILSDPLVCLNFIFITYSYMNFHSSGDQYFSGSLKSKPCHLKSFFGYKGPNYTWYNSLAG